MGEYFMAEAVASRTDTGVHESELDPKRWLVLIIIGLVQLMIVLDITIVNIALPTAQVDLGMSDANRQWVITAYTLAFAGLLLLGGRISDFVGRKRALLIGLTGFALASAVGGAATTDTMLIASRAVQGAFGALLGPTALALLAITYITPRDRSKAFAVYGAIGGGGSALGLILGGLLTEYVSWRWCLYVNVPIAIAAGISAVFIIKNDARNPDTKFDFIGAALATSGLTSLVYGFSKAETDGWGANITLTCFALAAILLATFVFSQTKVKYPLLPMRIVLDRNRGGAYISVLVNGIALFGSFFFLTYYLQAILNYSPVKTGLAFLPMTACVIINANVASRLLPIVRPRILIGSGLTSMVLGLLWLTQLTADSSYLTHIVPSLILLGLGLGWIFVPAINTGTLNIGRQDAGVAGAMVNTSQQVGASIGTSLLSTIAASATVSYIASHAASSTAQVDGIVHGYAVAMAWAAGILAVGAVVVFAMIKAGPLGSKTESAGSRSESTEGEGMESAIPAVHMG
jgi:EmrB/QacA subfamily drug resistance transporter